MKFSFFTNHGALNSKPVFEAFAHSVVKAGHTVLYNKPDFDVAVIWSILWHGRMSENKKIWEQCIQNNKPIIVLEVGCLDRGNLWKVGLNGINRDAYFAPKGNDNSRAKMLGLELQPWKHNEDGPIVICLQHTKSHQWYNMPPVDKWLDKTISTIRKRTDRDIILRPHPRCPLPGIEYEYKNVRSIHPTKISGSYDDYDFDMSDAYCVINWSSNPATQAIMQGIPAFVGPSSLAYDVAETDLKKINSPVMPDRTQWLNDLAHVEYTTHEIADGTPLKHLTDIL